VLKIKSRTLIQPNALHPSDLRKRTHQTSLYYRRTLKTSVPISIFKISIPRMTITNIDRLASGILLSLVSYPAAQAFIPSSTTRSFVGGPAVNNDLSISYSNTPFVSSPAQSQSRANQLKSSIFDDFEEFNNDSHSSSINDGGKQDDLFASLRARQDYLESGIKSESVYTYNSEDKILSNWKEAKCFSAVRLSLDDWIRRIAIDTYPLAVVGSAKGNIYLADLEKREELDCITSVHEEHIDHEEVNEAMKKLYGLYDGGGVISVAIHNDVVVSSGREGGVHVFKIDGEEVEKYKGSRGGTAKSTKLHLRSEGKIRYLDSSLITALTFDEDGLLWTSGYDGFIRAFQYDDEDMPLSVQKEPLYEIDVGSEVLSVSVNNDIGCGVAATAAGTAVLFSLEEGEIMSEWKPFGKATGKRKNEYARCAMIVNNDEESLKDDQKAIWSVVVGGSKGSMYQRRLNLDTMGYVSEGKPFVNDDALRGRLRPSHSNPVMCMASPSNGLLLSGSQDGTIRIWNCSYYRTHDENNPMASEEEDEEEAHYDDIGGEDKRPVCLYALTGYKLWFGSMFVNNKKLVSDGADNTIIVHDFSGDDDNAEGYSFEEGEDDDMEDFFD